MDQSYKLSDGYRNWATFVDEFQRIEESLQESKRVERVLVVRCNQLKSELVASGQQLHAVMSVRAEDERTMAALRKECDQSVVTSTEAKLKEKQAMVLVSGLQADIEALQAQVGVLQSALWLERERANAAVKASRTSTRLAAKVKPSGGAGGSRTSSSVVARMDPTSPASVAAAEAAAAAAGVLATSSTGGGVSSSGGSPARRKRALPTKRLVGGAGERAVHRGPSRSRRPATAAAHATHKIRGKFNASGGSGSGGRGGLYGEASGEFYGGDTKDMGGIAVFREDGGGRGAGMDSLTGTLTTGNESLGLGEWATYGIDSYFHGGGGEGGQNGQKLEHFTLDLDGRRGYPCGPGNEEEGEGGVSGKEIITPFQRWKISKGIVSPGVAEMFAAQGCCS